jgi:porin
MMHVNWIGRVVALALLLASALAIADEAASEESALARLAPRGITPEIGYVSEAFASLSGLDAKNADGMNIYRAGHTVYRGLLDLAVTIDTEELGIWSGGTAFVLGQSFRDRGVGSSEIGLMQGVSNIDAGESLTQLSECWYEQALLDERLRIRIGKQEANADFTTTDAAGDFPGASFGMPPMALIPSYPMMNLGAALFVRPVPSLEVRVGAYEGEEWGAANATGGTGVVSVGEVLCERALGSDGDYGGACRLGFWHHTGKATDGAGTELGGGNHGLYGMVEQMVYRSATGHELTAFAQYAQAPDDRNDIARYYSGGLMLSGVLLPWRAEDALGFGVVHSVLSDELGPTSSQYERIYDAYLRIPAASWITVVLDVQYVDQPGGIDVGAMPMSSAYVESGMLGGVRLEIGF